MIIFTFKLAIDEIAISLQFNVTAQEEFVLGNHLLISNVLVLAKCRISGLDPKINWLKLDFKFQSIYLQLNKKL